MLISISSNHVEYTGEENWEGHFSMTKELAISNVLRFGTSFVITILVS
jgi:hypothetical protein